MSKLLRVVGAFALVMAAMAVTMTGCSPDDEEEGGDDAATTEEAAPAE